MHRVRLSLGFTLIELLLVIACCIGVLAGIVIAAINPQHQLISANNAKRRTISRELQQAVYQYVIDGNTLPSDIPTTATAAKSICPYGQYNPGSCISLDALIDNNYVVSLPADKAGEGWGTIGYDIYQTGDQITVTPEYLGVKANVVTPSLTEIGTIKDGVGATLLNGATGVAVVGNYAYVVSISDASLSIIDISNPAAPTEVGTIKDGVGATQLSGVRSVTVVGNYAYVASFLDASLSVIDISNPAAPTEVGTIKDGVGATQLYGAISVSVVGNYAYVSSVIDDSLSIFDISNPVAPTEVGTIKDGVGAMQLNGAWDVAVVGNYAYVASSTDDSLSIIDISNPAAPIEVGTIEDSAGATRLNGANSVSVVGNYAYVASQNDDSLSVFSIR